MKHAACVVWLSLAIVFSMRPGFSQTRSAQAPSHNPDDLNSFRELVNVCQEVEKDASSRNFLRTGICIGYIAAAMDFVPLTNRRVCMPDKVEVRDSVKVILRYAEKHPDELYKSQFLEVAKAFRDAYPCKK